MDGAERRGNERNPSRVKYTRTGQWASQRDTRAPTQEPQTTGSIRLANYSSPAKSDPLVNKVLLEHIFFISFFFMSCVWWLSFYNSRTE